MTADDIEIHYATAAVNGIELHYACAGSGSLMVFVHGFPQFHYAFRAQLREFGTDHFAVASDQRGYNLLGHRPSGPARHAQPRQLLPRRRAPVRRRTDDGDLSRGRPIRSARISRRPRALRSKSHLPSREGRHPLDCRATP